jgi:subfamily B ATP-binding cassette protein HlyB/CyaB
MRSRRRRRERPVLVRRTEAEATDAVDATPRPFGFATVFAELLRHRDVVRDVLAASLALHLTALALPLASQAVIDKVIVNRASGTLAVVAAALALLIVFSALLGWLRQYLVVHTGTRVDAVLGSRVYAHLLACRPAISSAGRSACWWRGCTASRPFASS